MYNSGDIVLAKVQFTDTLEVKKRPCVILFQDKGNVIVAGITSNLKMQGIPLTVKEGAIKESTIKLNYIFTIAEEMIEKELFKLTPSKKQMVYANLIRYLLPLKFR